MKETAAIILAIFLAFSCQEKSEDDPIDLENWPERKIDITANDSLEYGKSYLSIYSQIYSLTEHKTHNLTAMVSLRNVSEEDSIYLLRAEYFDTHGVSVKKYFNYPIFVAPMETIEIIIKESDVSGGTGSNFIFEWKIPENCPEPLFEGVMNSTVGQQGLSFTTHSVRTR